MGKERQVIKVQQDNGKWLEIIGKMMCRGFC